MAENVSFLLDLDHDVHYTPSLVGLSSDRYIWYRLRREHLAENILFLRSDEDDKLVFHVCDSDSRDRLLQIAKFWGIQRREPTHEYKLQDLRVTEKEVLSLLRRRDRQQVALVLRYDILARICRSANDAGRRLLDAVLDGSREGIRLFVRLPQRAEELEACINDDVSDCPLLQKACSELQTVSNLDPEPLLQALQSLLGSRFLRLDDDPEEMRYLLMQKAVSDPGMVDSVEELEDLAEYLEICRMRRFDLMPAVASERFTPVPREEVSRKLQDADFRRSLREKVRKIRGSYPQGTIFEAVSGAHQLPKLPPFPMYQDELATTVMSLYIDNDYNRVLWGGSLDAVKRSFTVLWNKARNPEVIRIAKELCVKARKAIHKEDWKTYEKIEKLLKFYADQICTPPERNEALKTLWEKFGKLQIQLSESVYSRGLDGPSGGLTGLTEQGIDQGDAKILKSLTAIVNSTIYRFGRPELHLEDLREIEDRMEEDFGKLQHDIRLSEELEQYYHNSLNQNRQFDQPVEQDRFEDLEDALLRGDFRNQTADAKVDVRPEERQALYPEEARRSPVRENIPAEPIEPNAYLEQHFYGCPSAEDEYAAEEIFG